MSNETPARVFDQVQSEGRLAEILTSYSEGIELVDALTALRKKQVTIPDGLLKRVLDGPSDASLEDHKSNRRDGHVKKRILRVHVAILLLSRFTNQEEAASAAVCKGLVAEGVER